MRAILLILLASAVGYGALQIDRLDPDNYVKMYLGNYVVELKVVQFLILLLLIVLALYFLIWLFRSLWRSPKTVTRWWHRRSRDIAEDNFGAGYLSLIKGDWRRAESQLTKKSSHSHISYVNYLAAARAAAEQGKLASRDEYLQAAYKAAPKERLAIGLTKARLHERAGQIEEAEATLEDLRELGAGNPQYTAMVLQIYQQSKNWDGVQVLLPAAAKQKALPTAILQEMQNSVYLHKLQAADDQLETFKNLPRAQRKRMETVAVYAQALVDAGDSAAAEKHIRAALKSDWSDKLVDIYGQLITDKPAKLLRQVQGWLMARPENAHLNLAAGRLAKACNQMDEAKQYLQTAISQGKLPAAYSVLGEVYEASNESGKALQMYRVGMQAIASGHVGVEAKVDEAETGEIISADSQLKLNKSSPGKAEL